MNSNHTHSVSSNSNSLHAQALSLAPSGLGAPLESTSALTIATPPGRPENRRDGTSHEATNVVTVPTTGTTNTFPDINTSGLLSSTRPSASPPSNTPVTQNHPSTAPEHDRRAGLSAADVPSDVVGSLPAQGRPTSLSDGELVPYEGPSDSELQRDSMQSTSHLAGIYYWRPSSSGSDYQEDYSRYSVAASTRSVDEAIMMRGQPLAISSQPIPASLQTLAPVSGRNASPPSSTPPPPSSASTTPIPPPPSSYLGASSSLPPPPPACPPARLRSEDSAPPAPHRPNRSSVESLARLAYLEPGSSDEGDERRSIRPADDSSVRYGSSSLSHGSSTTANTSIEMQTSFDSLSLLRANRQLLRATAQGPTSTSRHNLHTACVPTRSRSDGSSPPPMYTAQSHSLPQYNLGHSSGFPGAPPRYAAAHQPPMAPSYGATYQPPTSIGYAIAHQPPTSTGYATTHQPPMGIATSSPGRGYSNTGSHTPTSTRQEPREYLHYPQPFPNQQGVNQRIVGNTPGVDRSQHQPFNPYALPGRQGASTPHPLLPPAFSGAQLSLRPQARSRIAHLLADAATASPEQFNLINAADPTTRTLQGPGPGPGPHSSTSNATHASNQRVGNFSTMGQSSPNINPASTSNFTSSIASPFPQHRAQYAMDIGASTQRLSPSGLANRPSMAYSNRVSQLLADIEAVLLDELSFILRSYSGYYWDHT